MQPIVSIDFAKDIRRADHASAARHRRMVETRSEATATHRFGWLSRIRTSLPARPSTHRAGI